MPSDLHPPCLQEHKRRHKRAIHRKRQQGRPERTFDHAARSDAGTYPERPVERKCDEHKEHHVVPGIFHGFLPAACRFAPADIRARTFRKFTSPGAAGRATQADVTSDSFAGRRRAETCPAFPTPCSLSQVPLPASRRFRRAPAIVSAPCCAHMSG